MISLGLAGARRRLDKVRILRIDVLVNVVGGTIWWQPYHLYTEQQIALELERSLYTNLWCCHAVLPR